ncbi:MAG: hypothetical protein AB7I27_17375 [Bacteriovoracaceae bacterium]
MKRKDFYALIHPLAEKLYRVAYALIPDDLQAEQLVIDGLNAYLIKERKHLLRKELSHDKREVQVLRKIIFKGLLHYLSDIGLRRSVQLAEQMKQVRPSEFAAFYQLDGKVRLILSLRFECQLSIEEVEEISKMPRFEVIEKMHNGRFLLKNELNKGVSL